MRETTMTKAMDAMAAPPSPLMEKSTRRPGRKLPLRKGNSTKRQDRVATTIDATKTAIFIFVVPEGASIRM